MLPALSYVDQLNLILSVLGTPDDETLTRVGSDKACKYIRSLPRVEPVDFATLYPEADPLGQSRCRIETSFILQGVAHLIIPSCPY